MMLGYTEVETFFSDHAGQDCRLKVSLQKDDSISLCFEDLQNWRKIFTLRLPAPVDLLSLGLLIRTFRNYQPAYAIFELNTGLSFNLMNEDIEGDLDEMRETQNRRGYHAAIDQAVEILQTAAQPLSNHRKMEILASKPFKHALITQHLKK